MPRHLRQSLPWRHIVADRWLALLIGSALVVWLIALVLILYATMTLN